MTMPNQWLKSGSSNRPKLIDFTITMNQQTKHDRQQSTLMDAYARAYAKQNPQSGLLNLTDALKQADQHKENT